jgi:hypothetical protein
MIGAKDIGQAVRSATVRSAKSMATTGVGALAHAVGLGPLSIPVAFFMGVSLNRLQNRDAIHDNLAEQTDRMRAFRMFMYRRDYSFGTSH